MAFPDPKARRPRAYLVLWGAMLGAPVAWAIGMEAVYALTTGACEHENKAALHIMNLFFLALAIAGGWLAWRSWKTVGGWPSDKDPEDVDRVRLMSVVGMMGAALFVFLLFAQWLAILLLDPCPW